jgi:hypothetical protein
MEEIGMFISYVKQKESGRSIFIRFIVQIYNALYSLLVF